MPIGEICNSTAVWLSDWKVISCDTACAMCYREDIPSCRNFTLILFLASPLIYKQITETTELKNRKSLDWKTL